MSDESFDSLDDLVNDAKVDLSASRRAWVSLGFAMALVVPLTISGIAYGGYGAKNGLDTGGVAWAFVGIAAVVGIVAWVCFENMCPYDYDRGEKLRVREARKRVRRSERNLSVFLLKGGGLR